jgi:uncharacterized protein with HEPN domain
LKGDLLYAAHILDCIERIERYCAAGREAFLSDTLIQDAVLRNLQILAESAQRISPEVKDQHPQVDWRAISGFRNVLVHDYLGLDLARVWQIVSVDVPVLKRQIASIRSLFGG